MLGVVLTFLLATTMGIRAASAEGNSNWRVEGLNVGPALLPDIQIASFETGGLTVLSKIAGANVGFTCATASLEGFQLNPTGSVSAEGKVRFTSCQTKLNESLSAPCEPLAGSEKGVVVSKPLKGLLQLHEGTWIVRLEASSGETLATVEMSKECSIGTKVPVIGKLTLKDPKFGEDLVTHLVSEGPLTELWVISKTTEHKAVLDGSALIELAGEFKGVSWSSFEATEGPSWKFGGSKPKSSLLPLVGVKSGGLSFLTTLSGIKFVISCSAVALINASLETKGLISSGFRMKFSGCLVKVNEEASECSFGGGAVETTTLTGVLNSEEIIIESQSVGGNIMTIEFNKFCPIAGKAGFFGKIGLRDSDLRTEAGTHLFSEGPSTALWFINEVPSHKTTLGGSVTLALSGIHAGLMWSGVLE